MGRILLAFGICQAVAVAAFLWVLPRELARRPEELSAWAAAAAGWFWVLAWPLLDERR
ncbi:MAG: hypothetical protein HUU15_06600, partial [Candidatus Brocadiae bacterium]|nr:hypothetical protein [Candidatus Brocadiia bacterium]